MKIQRGKIAEALLKPEQSSPLINSPLHEKNKFAGSKNNASIKFL